jgi:RNA polymerase sigma-70 factor (ECF subfamily)
VEFDPNRHFEVDFAPDQIAAGREDLRTVSLALLSLPERTRTILILHRLEGLRQREIAQRLGISVSAVEKHLIRALRHLSGFFGDDLP